MTNVFATNFPQPGNLAGVQNSFQSNWKLTRVMKQAGWTYRSSGDGTNKDVSGNPANDLWGGSATSTQDSYAAGSIIASTTLATSTSFPVTNASVSVTSTSGFNPSGGVFYVGGFLQPVTYTGASGNVFTGCNGGPPLSGTTATTVKGLPAQLDSTVGWVVLSGPQTVKVTLSAAPIGTPIRGEIVTQSSSGATGELFGYVWDTVGLTGWAVIGPQNAPLATTSSYGSTTLNNSTTNISTFTGSGTLTVISTSGFASSGTVYVWAGGFMQPITYSGIGSGTTFTGCNSNGGSGAMAVGYPALGAAAVTSSTITVASTSGFPTSGYFEASTSTGVVTVFYTGIGSSTTFTGCTTLSTGNLVTGYAINGFASCFNSTSSFTGAISGATFAPLSTTTTSSQSVASTTIAVTSTLGFPNVGIANIVVSGGATVAVAYTGTTSTSLLGCTSAATGTTTIGGTVSAVPVTFNREVLFGKPDTATAHDIYIAYICADPISEQAVFLSTLSVQTGCTALIAPSCGGTNNGFSTVSPVTGIPMIMSVKGLQIAAGNFTTANAGFALGNATILGANCQIACVNNVPAMNVTADGSFYIVASVTTSGYANGYFFTRVDDSEPGDCDPYVFWTSNNTNEISNNNTVFSRLGSATIGGVEAWDFQQQALGVYNGSIYACFWGYQARGNTFITRDIPASYCSSFLGLTWNTSVPIQGFAPSTQIRSVAHPGITPPLVREPVTMYSIGPTYATNLFRQIKGRTRWLVAYSVGNILDTYDSKTWLNVQVYNPALPGNENSPALAIGPYDGLTTPMT